MNSIARSNTERVLHLAREHGMLRSHELARYGLAREYLTCLTPRGCSSAQDAASASYPMRS